MQYILIELTKGLFCQAYQEIENGMVVRYTDMNGNTLELPEIIESHAVNKEYVIPEWTHV